MIKEVALRLMLVASFVGIGFLAGKLSAATELNNLKGQIEHAEREAQARYNELMAKRDALALRLQEAAKHQEEIDNAAKIEIKRLSNELASRPVRVRVETESRACGDSTRSTETESTNAGEADRSETYGLLPRANSERLRNALDEIEMLNAAYASCRKTLIVEY